MIIQTKAYFGRAWKSMLLILILSSVLVACGQEQAEQDPAGGDPDVSEEAADVAQESEELAEATGEEIEEGAADAATAAAQAGEELEPTVEQAGQEIGTAAAQAGEEIQEEAEEVSLPQELTSVEGVTISELDDNLDNYISQTVAVRGDVVEIIGANAFQVSDPSALGGDEVLVVGTNVNTDTIAVENTVEVSGVVRRFDLVAVEEETGLDLQDDVFTDMDDDNAVIIAQEVVNVPGADE